MIMLVATNVVHFLIINKTPFIRRILKRVFQPVTTEGKVFPGPQLG
jgi:hypothetical protein